MCSINKSIDKVYMPVIWFIQQSKPNHSGNAPEPCEGTNARLCDRQQSKDGEQISDTRSQGKGNQDLFIPLRAFFSALKAIRKDSAEHGKSRSSRRYTGSF